MTVYFLFPDNIFVGFTAAVVTSREVSLSLSVDEVEETGRVELTCHYNLSGQRPISVYFIRYNRYIAYFRGTSNPYVIDIYNDKFSHLVQRTITKGTTIVLKNAEMKDEGEYYCYATGGYGYSTRRSLVGIGKLLLSLSALIMTHPIPVL